MAIQEKCTDQGMDSDIRRKQNKVALGLQPRREFLNGSGMSCQQNLSVVRRQLPLNPVPLGKGHIPPATLKITTIRIVMQPAGNAWIAMVMTTIN